MLVVFALYSIGYICNHALAECPITDRESNFNEQLILYNALIKNYQAKLPAVAVQFANMTVKIPRFEVLLTVNDMKLTQVDWRDERLIWNPEDYCGLDHIYVPRSNIWNPDVIAIDVHSFENYRIDEDDYVRVNSSGHVHFFILTRTATVCPIDIQDFPFDQQDCAVNLTALPFSDDEYYINLALEPFSSKDYERMGNEEWRITYVAAVNDLVDDQELSSIIILMKRSPSLYITMIITPPFVVNILSIFGVFMNITESMGKLGMALTNVMSLTFVLGILATDLPKTQKLPKIVIFVLGNLLVMVLALITTEVLPYIKQIFFRHKEGDKKKLSCFYRTLEWVLCVLFEIANLINFIVLLETKSVRRTG
ncbi:unnamed protein product [Cylicocyclus nassatus]|uniref:Neurotransmitter-gated ion-channel ligand-binding domain-containing protein n=1 Tax=Cylicocyclus nassatus TaxID=53992 RepID=A0AA36H5K3_CYLNA|nr:unnamed protein product [Cylicocyclus nassatus]